MKSFCQLLANSVENRELFRRIVLLLPEIILQPKTPVVHCYYLKKKKKNKRRKKRKKRKAAAHRENQEVFYSVLASHCY